jgi:putative FmdB family regulatory protein
MRYEFQCQDCGCKFEIVLPVDCLATANINCPNCHSEKIKKQFNLFGLIFRGQGFYKTDNRKGKEDG